MNKKEKETIVKELETKFEKCSSSVFTEFRGLTVQNMEKLRNRARTAKLEFKVIKNTLAKRAYSSLNYEENERFFIGPTAIAFGWDDPVIPIKVLTEFSKESPGLILKGGLIDGVVVKEDKLETLATLPPKEVLISQVLGGLQSPLRNFITVLNSPIVGLINCLKAIEQKQG